MKKFFTLIELIVVIAVLGILAAIIIPNISSFQEEANDTAIVNNVRNLQTGVDMYAMDNYGAVPTMAGEPTKFNPKPVDFDAMIPDYTRDLPETPGINYWVDAWGKVWASTIDAPKNVDLTTTTLKWDTVSEADMYKVYKVLKPTTSSISEAGSQLSFYKDATKDEYIGIEVEEGFDYAVSAVDKKGFESAPAGAGYSGYPEMIEAHRVQDSQVSNSPIVVQSATGIFSFENGSIINKVNNKNYSVNGASILSNDAIQINGQQISIPTSDLNFAGADKVSIAFWFKWSGTDSVMPVGFHSYDYWCVEGNCGYNTGQGDVYGIANPYSTSNFVHTVVIFDNGNVTEGKIYINGVKQVTSQKRSSPLNSLAVIGSELNISGWDATSGYRLNGSQLSGLKTWNRQLTMQEVEELYNYEITK